AVRAGAAAGQPPRDVQVIPPLDRRNLPGALDVFGGVARNDVVLHECIASLFGPLLRHNVVDEIQALQVSGVDVRVLLHPEWARDPYAHAARSSLSAYPHLPDDELQELE